MIPSLVVSSIGTEGDYLIPEIPELIAYVSVKQFFTGNVRHHLFFGDILRRKLNLKIGNLMTNDFHIFSYGLQLGVR